MFLLATTVVQSEMNSLLLCFHSFLLQTGFFSLSVKRGKMSSADSLWCVKHIKTIYFLSTIEGIRDYYDSYSVGI